MHDGARVVEDVACMHGGESDDATVGDCDQRVRIAASAQTCKPRWNLGRRRRIAEVTEQLRHRRRVVVARRTDVEVAAHEVPRVRGLDRREPIT